MGTFSTICITTHLDCGIFCAYVFPIFVIAILALIGFTCLI